MSRSLLNAARSPSFRPSSAFRRPPSPLPPNFVRQSFTNPRSLGVLACAQSLMPMHTVVADARLTSHIVVDARACCELSQGTISLHLSRIVALQLLLY
ncbi:Histone-lysine N-methyltransferase SETDB1 [Bienertia sinuspersici]